MCCACTMHMHPLYLYAPMPTSTTTSFWKEIAVLVYLDRLIFLVAVLQFTNGGWWLMAVGGQQPRAVDGQSMLVGCFTLLEGANAPPAARTPPTLSCWRVPHTATHFRTTFPYICDMIQRKFAEEKVLHSTCCVRERWFAYVERQCGRDFYAWELWTILPALNTDSTVQRAHIAPAAVYFAGAKGRTHRDPLAMRTLGWTRPLGLALGDSGFDATDLGASLNRHPSLKRSGSRQSRRTTGRLQPRNETKRNRGK